MKDDVLRCAVMVKDTPAGFTGRLVDTLDAGDRYTLVFKWVRPEGKDGWIAARTLSIPKSEFTHSNSLSTGYELILQQPVDLTQIHFRDVDASTADIPDSELRHPRPNDEPST